VFDPFFTTKPFGEGTGLGLDVAARIVDRHDGSLWAESTPGDTRFITSLPI
jgi:signal transduction histidine kinase